MGLWRRAKRETGPIPWLGVEFDHAVAQVEALSRERGGVGARTPDFEPEEIDACEARLGVRLPDGLRSFYEWWSRELWLDLMNPERTRKGEYHPGGIYNTKGEKIEGDHPDNTVVEPIPIDKPREIELVQHPWPESAAFLQWEPCIEAGVLGPEWREMRAIKFGLSLFGDGLLCLLEPVGEHPVESILMTTEDDVCVIVCAHSIGEWLAKLAHCGGFEAADTPGSVPDLPRALRAHVVHDFNRLNTRSTWFR